MIYFYLLLYKMLKISHRTCILLFVISCIPGISVFRLEPLDIVKNREIFYNNYFEKFTNNLKLNYTLDKGYQCIVKKNIYYEEDVFIIPKNLSYSCFDEFPLKSKLYETIINNEIVSRYLNMTSNLLLTTRLLFDIKANITDVFILMKRYDKKEESYNFENFKEYLKSRGDFYNSFLNTIPLANILGQTSWSDDDIKDYKFTGFLPVIKNQIIRIFHSLSEDFKKDKIFKEFTNSWFKSSNLNYFLSIYGYVISRSFKINLNEFKLEKSDSNEINKKINKIGASIIIPFIELCNHYQPQVQKDSKGQLKSLKILFDTDKINIKSLSQYDLQDEFSFSYSNLLTNDFFLLNYGFIIKNNMFQEFVFRFDIEDQGHKFYKKLLDKNFNIDRIIVDDKKLSIQFPLLFNELSSELIEFIEAYIEVSDHLNNDNGKYSHPKSKTLLKLKNSISVMLLNLLKKYQLYYITVHQNIKTFLNEMKINTIENFIEETENFEKQIEILNHKIEETSKHYLIKYNNTDDIPNLSNFKDLHILLKKSLIRQFNIENIKILFSQERLIFDNLFKFYGKNILDLKNLYV